MDTRVGSRDTPHGVVAPARTGVVGAVCDPKFYLRSNDGSMLFARMRTKTREHVFFYFLCRWSLEYEQFLDG
jgi:hypothetical protein